jgi:hypothetical protein
LGKLERETIGSSDELTKQFTSNFKSTYKRPASIEKSKLAYSSAMRHLDHTYKDGALSKIL